MKIAIPLCNRSSEVVLPIEDYYQLRPVVGLGRLESHLKGKIPDEILTVVKGALADT
jgi:hypothetical protein